MKNNSIQLILASASRDRKKLFEQINVQILIFPSHFDEKQVSIQDPETLVEALALGKANDVANRWKMTHESEDSGIIIGADTIGFINGKIIGKPANFKESVSMIMSLSGKWHSVYTGVAILCTNSDQQLIFTVHTRVHFQDLSREEILAYLNESNEYHGRAAAYSIGDRAELFIDRIEGSYSNIVGLPMAELRISLKEFGVNLLNTQFPK
ncbi:MAG: Maf family protein [Promethearchaeota archaeon]